MVFLKPSNGSKVHGDQKIFFRNLSSAAIVQIKSIYDDLTSDDILVVCQATPKIRMSLYIQKSGKNVQRINMQGTITYCLFVE